MINFFYLGIFCFGLGFLIFILDLLFSANLGSNTAYMLSIIIRGELFHFIEKTRLVNGDLVIIKFRGKYRKAYVKNISLNHKTFQLEFEDSSLNVRPIEYNWYCIERIIIPEYLGKAAGVLFISAEKKTK
jgi:hypothetical protein